MYFLSTIAYHLIITTWISGICRDITFVLQYFIADWGNSGPCCRSGTPVILLIELLEPQDKQQLWYKWISPHRSGRDAPFKKGRINKGGSYLASWAYYNTATLPSFLHYLVPLPYRDQNKHKWRRWIRDRRGLLVNGTVVGFTSSLVNAWPSVILWPQRNTFSQIVQFLMWFLGIGPLCCCGWCFSDHYKCN